MIIQCLGRPTVPCAVLAQGQGTGRTGFAGSVPTKVSSPMVFGGGRGQAILLHAGEARKQKPAQADMYQQSDMGSCHGPRGSCSMEREGADFSLAIGAASLASLLVRHGLPVQKLCCRPQGT